jgi:hypothetical protein
MSRRCWAVLLLALLTLAAGPAAADEHLGEDPEPVTEPVAEPVAELEADEGADAVDDPGALFAPNPYLEHGFGAPFGFVEPAPAVLAGSGTDALLRAPDLRGTNAPTMFERYGSQGLALEPGVGAYGADQGLAVIASGVFAIATWLAHGVIATVQWAFSLELFDFVGHGVAGIVDALRDTLYLPFVQAAVILGGLYGLWHGLVRRRGTFAAEGLSWTVFALAAAALFFTFPGALTSGANHLSTGLTRTVLAGVSAVDPKPLPPDGTGAAATFHGHPADTQLRVAGDRFWRVFVYQPWLVLQFGEAEVGAAYGERLLAARTITTAEYEAVAGDPDGFAALAERKRDEYAALQEELLADPRLAPWVQGRRAVDRLGVATLALVGVLVGGLLLALVAAAVLLAQIAFLLLVLLGPVALLVGIHPGAGRVIALRWAELALGLLVKRVALGALLAVILVVNGLLLEATQPLGWLVVMGLQALVIAAAVAYRKPFSRLFAPTTVPRVATEAARQLGGGRAGPTAGRAATPQSMGWRPQARRPAQRAARPTAGPPAERPAQTPTAAPPRAPLRRSRRRVGRRPASERQAAVVTAPAPPAAVRSGPAGNGHTADPEDQP